MECLSNPRATGYLRARGFTFIAANHTWDDRLVAIPVNRKRLINPQPNHMHLIFQVVRSIHFANHI